MTRASRQALASTAIAAALGLACGHASAQSLPSPIFYYGFVPTPAQWNAYFQQKQDYLGFVPVGPGSLVGVAPITVTPSGAILNVGFSFSTNNTWTGSNAFSSLVNIAVSGTAGANFNLGCPSTAPGAPNNGDMWCTGSGLFLQAGGVTIGPFGAVTGLLASNNTWTGTNTFANSMTVSGTLAAPAQIGVNGTVGWFRAGLTLGNAPTGGDQGAGTENVTGGYYVNGTQIFPPIGTQNLYYNSTGGSALPTGQTVTAVLDNYFGASQGAVIYRGASAWQELTAGTAGYVFTTNGAGANPSWAPPASGGTMGQVTITGANGITVAGVSGGGCSSTTSIGCQISAAFLLAMQGVQFGGP